MGGKRRGAQSAAHWVSGAQPVLKERRACREQAVSGAPRAGAGCELQQRGGRGSCCLCNGGVTSAATAQLLSMNFSDLSDCH